METPTTARLERINTALEKAQQEIANHSRAGHEFSQACTSLIEARKDWRNEVVAELEKRLQKQIDELKKRIKKLEVVL